MADTLTYPPVTDELLREVVRRILAVGSPEKIILFGSRARGDARPDSDLDLLIVEDTTEPRHRRSPQYYHALADVFPEKDIVVWTPEEMAEWAQVPGALGTTAVREGRLLFVRSGSSRRLTTVAAKSNADLARGWLSNGDDGVSTIQILLAAGGPPRMACYHAQQAAEKYLKAFLAAQGQAIPKTHDLRDLFSRCRTLAPSWTIQDVDWVKLTGYAVLGRYAFDFDPDHETAEQALGMVENVRAAVLAALPPEAHREEA
jgi:HEPN domain-containing protein/predicted nucleotidyltransferase